MKTALQINESDNVATATKNIEQDEKVQIISPEGDTVIITESLDYIPFGHKIAIKPFSEGEEILKYGEIIGLASKQIKPGEWVHVHNVVSARLHVEGPERGIL
ncbi:MAG: D-galactarate dehydratase [Candidatus Thorarchaeota archaeon]|nr:D-galactarate dehydratase [Candidatus Thorarchaeota archaeon]NIW12679.1 D-galactarate dehydratase [Candidatus Thorarchaeota archaeon]NIW50886.1 D-galactarate dehydratase [Candidatus Korarchaeota archaeon]